MEGCYSCGKVDEITIDCICDPDGVEYMTWTPGFELTREGYEPKFRELSLDKLKSIQAAFDFFMSAKLDEATIDVEEARVLMDVIWFKSHVARTIEVTEKKEK